VTVLLSESTLRKRLDEVIAIAKKWLKDASYEYKLHDERLDTLRLTWWAVKFVTTLDNQETAVEARVFRDKKLAILVENAPDVPLNRAYAESAAKLLTISLILRYFENIVKKCTKTIFYKGDPETPHFVMFVFDVVNGKAIATLDIGIENENIIISEVLYSPNGKRIFTFESDFGGAAQVFKSFMLEILI